LLRGNTLYVFFSAIGDSPEKIMLATIQLNGDWRNWKASSAQDVLAPREAFECIDLPPVSSRPGEIEGWERALRDPGLIEENGKVILFYSYCENRALLRRTSPPLYQQLRGLAELLAKTSSALPYAQCRRACPKGDYS
jgi:hypothetical protein